VLGWKSECWFIVSLCYRTECIRELIFNSEFWEYVYFTSNGPFTWCMCAHTHTHTHTLVQGKLIVWFYLVLKVACAAMKTVICHLSEHVCLNIVCVLVCSNLKTSLMTVLLAANSDIGKLVFLVWVMLNVVRAVKIHLVIRVFMMEYSLIDELTKTICHYCASTRSFGIIQRAL
jgi:hypothetical protein